MVVRAEFLQGHIGVSRLVRRIGIDQHGLLVGHHLLQDRGDGLALGEPLPSDLRQQLRRVGLVDQDRPRGPAIRERQSVQIIEQAGRGRGRKAGDGEDAEVLIAKAWLQPAGQRLISQQRVEIDRRLGNTDAMTFRRNAGMEVSQRLAIIEPRAFRHEAVEQRDNAIGAIGEAAQNLMRIDA